MPVGKDGTELVDNIAYDEPDVARAAVDADEPAETSTREITQFCQHAGALPELHDRLGQNWSSASLKRTSSVTLSLVDGTAFVHILVTLVRNARYSETSSLSEKRSTARATSFQRSRKVLPFLQDSFKIIENELR